MNSPDPAHRRRIGWAGSVAPSGARGLLYRGPLRGDLRLHFGFDGWQGDPREIRLEPVSEGEYRADVPDVEGHLALDCVITNGDEWDNNAEADYRLWVTVDPFDAHLHSSGTRVEILDPPPTRVAPDLQAPVDEVLRNLELGQLETALQSAGVAGGLTSFWMNRGTTQVTAAAPGLKGLVWIQPEVTLTEDVDRYLDQGFVGLKFHPTLDDRPADDEAMDPYLDVADRRGVPVCIHSAPGAADPDFIRRLAERFPRVSILLYHTYLGPEEGRWRAVDHVRDQPNLYLETSWCRTAHVLRFVEEAGPEKVLFGSDASVDGVQHFCRQPPNVDALETYNEGLIRLVGALDPAAARLVMGDNARRLFRLERA